MTSKPLVQRLRETYTAREITDGMIYEAADEIERLTAELHALKSISAKDASRRIPDETKAYPHAPLVPDEYLARVQSVVSQGIAILGKPRGVRAGADADEWLRNLAGLPKNGEPSL